MFASSAAFCASTPAHTPGLSSKPNGGETPIAQNRTPCFLIRSIVGDETSQAFLTAGSTSVGIAGGWNLPVAAFPEATPPPAWSPPQPREHGGQDRERAQYDGEAHVASRASLAPDVRAGHHHAVSVMRGM